MKGNTSIRIKALCLLLVFGMTTGVGVACALGMDFCFTPQCHCPAKKCCSNDRNGCCNDLVIKLHHQDQPMASSVVGPDAPGWFPLVSTFVLRPVEAPVEAARPMVRHYYPPPPNIRIWIQSFQV